MRRLILHSTVTAILLATVSASVALAQPLTGEWKLVASEITLRFTDDGSIEGFGGCNAYFGNYEQAGESFSVFDLGWTEMACSEPEGVLEQENQFFANLMQVSVIRVEGEALALIYDGASELQFVFVFPVPAPSDYADREWRLESIDVFGSPQPVIPGSQITIFFDGDLSVRGSGGCNGFTATWVSDDDGQFQIAQYGATDMACSSPDGVMEQELQFEQSLVQVVSIRLDGESGLTLFFGTDGALRFQAVDVPTAVAERSWAAVKAELSR